MSPATRRHLMWSRVGVALSVGLIAFGAVVALPSHHHAGAGPALMPVPGAMAGRVANLPVQMLAAQQTAERFVTACDTTDPAHPAGDVATEAALAPGLEVTHDVVEPAAWSSEDRATKVALDAPGQPVTEHGDTVAVIVTGTMTVTSDSGPPQVVPVAERIALHPLNHDHSVGDQSAGDRGASGWQVVDVEVGA